MIKFSVSDWYAWSPGLDKNEDWEKWAVKEGLNPGELAGDREPEPERVGTRQRRRLSRLTEMLLTVAFEVCDRGNYDPSTLANVFASRHGEVERTLDLLKTIARDGLISPMAFSNSVHNTASGYFGINADNKHPSHSVSCGVDTFPQGLLDAVALSQTSETQAVLYVCGDILLPKPLDQWKCEPPVEYAVGFIIENRTDHRGRMEMKCPMGRVEQTSCPGLWFLKHALTGKKTFSVETALHEWSFDYDDFPRNGEKIKGCR